MDIILIIIILILILISIFFVFFNKPTKKSERFNNMKIRDNFMNEIIPFDYNDSHIDYYCFSLSSYYFNEKYKNEYIVNNTDNIAKLSFIYGYGDIIPPNSKLIQNNLFITNLHIQYDNPSNIMNAQFQYNDNYNNNYKYIPIEYSTDKAPLTLSINKMIDTAIIPTLTEKRSAISIDFNSISSTVSKFGSNYFNDKINVSFYGYCSENTRDSDNNITQLIGSRFPPIKQIENFEKTQMKFTDSVSAQNYLNNLAINYMFFKEILNTDIIIQIGQTESITIPPQTMLNESTITLMSGQVKIEANSYGLNLINYSSLNINGGVCTSNVSGIQVSSDSIININGGILNCTNDKLNFGFAKSITNEGTINMVKGALNITNLVGTGITNGKKINITGGTLNINNSGGTGIDNKLSSSQITVSKNAILTVNSTGIGIKYIAGSTINILNKIYTNDINIFPDNNPTTTTIQIPPPIINDPTTTTIQIPPPIINDPTTTTIQIPPPIINDPTTTTIQIPPPIINNSTSSQRAIINETPLTQYNKLFTVQFALSDSDVSDGGMFEYSPQNHIIVYNYFKSIKYTKEIKDSLTDLKNTTLNKPLDDDYFTDLASKLNGTDNSMTTINTSTLIPNVDTRLNTYYLEKNPELSNIIKPDTIINFVTMVKKDNGEFKINQDVLTQQPNNIIAIPLISGQVVSLVDSESNTNTSGVDPKPLINITRNNNDISIDGGDTLIPVGTVFQIPKLGIIYKFISIGSPMLLKGIDSPKIKPSYELKYDMKDITNIYSTILCQSNAILKKNQSTTSPNIDTNNTQTLLTLKSNYTNESSILSNMFISNIHIQYNGTTDGVKCQLINGKNIINLDITTSSPPQTKNKNNDLANIKTQIINTTMPMPDGLVIPSEDILIPLTSNNTKSHILISFPIQNQTTNGSGNGFNDSNFNKDSITIAYYGYFRKNIVTSEDVVFVYEKKLPEVNAIPNMTLYAGEGFENTRVEKFQATGPLYPNLFSVTLPISSSNIDTDGNVTGINNDIQIPSILSSTISCFNEGTDILCYSNMKEEYCKIQDIRPGKLVKTYKHGYRKVIKIGKRSSTNNPDNWMECMYKLPKEKNMTDDLIISGLHGIMVDSLNREDIEKYKELKAFDNLTKIDNMFVLVAAASNRFTKITDNNTYTYYHLILDNESDMNARYGVYANGVLTETPTVKIFDENKFELLE